MNNDEIILKLYNDIKEIERNVSNDYVGKRSDKDLKAYQKDVVSLIVSKLDDYYSMEKEGNSNENKED